MAYTTPQTGTASIEDGKSIILFLEAQRPNGRGYIKKQSVIDESKIVILLNTLYLKHTHMHAV